MTERRDFADNSGLWMLILEKAERIIKLWKKKKKKKEWEEEMVMENIMETEASVGAVYILLLLTKEKKMK